MPNGVRSANLGVRWAEKAAGPAQRYLGNQRRRKKNQGPRSRGSNQDVKLINEWGKNREELSFLFQRT